MKVLVTAFKPFNKNSNNFSMEVLNYIEGVDKVVLDVLYDESFNELKKSYDLNQYDLIIAMGEARMRDELTLEVCATNISSCSLPDNNNIVKNEEVIINNGPKCLKTGLNVSRLENDIKISNYAGKFVCNNIYYHLLYEYQDKALFIHIPNCILESDYKRYALKIMQLLLKLQ